MLESSKLGDNIRVPLRREFSEFIERAPSKCDYLENYVADLKEILVIYSTPTHQKRLSLLKIPCLGSAL